MTTAAQWPQRGPWVHEEALRAETTVTRWSVYYYQRRCVMLKRFEVSIFVFEGDVSIQGHPYKPNDSRYIQKLLGGFRPGLRTVRNGDWFEFHCEAVNVWDAVSQAKMAYDER